MAQWSFGQCAIFGSLHFARGRSGVEHLRKVNSATAAPENCYTADVARRALSARQQGPKLDPSVIQFDERIERMDLGLFASIASQSSKLDRLSWLAVQRAVRSDRSYVYVEIGSYKGGSLQQHFLDPRCRRIISIDKRGLVYPDNRGSATYKSNSEAEMVAMLTRLDPGQSAKLQCLDAGVEELNPTDIEPKADLCFIDGEHTDTAVLRDFEFCRRISGPNAIILFHDDHITPVALMHVVEALDQEGVVFSPQKLGGSTFGIFLGNAKTEAEPFIAAIARNGRLWLWQQRIKAITPEWILRARRVVLKRFRRFMARKASDARVSRP